MGITKTFLTQMFFVFAILGGIILPQNSWALVSGYACDPGTTCVPAYSGQMYKGQCVCAKSCGARNSCVDKNSCIDIASKGQVCNVSEPVVETGPTCQDTYQGLVARCDEQIRATEEGCDAKNSSEMNGVTNTASQLSVALGSQSAASITSACSGMGALAGAANAAVAAYRMMCSSSISSCKSACSEMHSYAEQNYACLQVTGSGNAPSSSALKAKVERCSEFDAKVEEANQAITNLISTAKNASQCASLTTGDVTVPAICTTYPTMVGCTTTTVKDCNDATEAATNLVCICSANPTSEKCVKGLNSSGVSAATSTTDFQSRLNGASASGDGDINDLPEIAHGKPSSGRGAAAADGKMGGSPVGGGGGGSGSGVAPIGGGAGGSSEDKYDTAGFYGGGGRGGGFGSAPGSGNGSAGSGGQGAAGAAGANGPDLRKFLPGGQYDPKRGMAGAGGPDGITGPNTNIWLKIQNRYRVMSPTLLP